MELTEKIREIYNSNPSYYSQVVRDKETYDKFLSLYPKDNLENVTLEDYCLGKNSKDNNFCWWIERGLEPAIGRYAPGSAKAHVIYKHKDGHIWKHRFLDDYSDDEAVTLIMKVTKLLASASSLKEAINYDDNTALLKAAGYDEGHTMGSARKLRIFGAYNPDKIVPMYASGHIEHYLRSFEISEDQIQTGDFALAQQLWEVFLKVKEQIGDLSPDGFGRIIWSDELGIKPESGTSVDSLQSSEDIDPLDLPKNVILYGPPGTGKTYRTVNRSLMTLDPAFYDLNKNNRQNLLARFNELKDEGRIGFVTFHQSFSYEEFVEGLKAEADENGNIRYVIEDGIFKKMCSAAASRITRTSDKQIDLSGKKIWKMSLGDTQAGEDYIYQECIDNNQALLGWGANIDFSSCDTREDVHRKYLEESAEVQSTDYKV